MVGAKVAVKMDTKTLEQRAKQGTFRSLGHAAASIRLAAKRLFRRSAGPSQPGEPPHTHTRRMPDAILYDVDREAGSAIIGTAKSITGEAGYAHEHGGSYKGDTFEARPFMRPALLRLQGRLAEHWRNSITG